jgi:hypothetical protein
VPGHPAAVKVDVPIRSSGPHSGSRSLIPLPRMLKRMFAAPQKLSMNEMACTESASGLTYGNRKGWHSVSFFLELI